MFKRAVDNHKATTASQKPHAQQLFPSSSPTVESTLKQSPQPINSRSLSTGYNNILRPSPSVVLNGPNSRTGIQSGASYGIKRTASGLAKALNSQNSFEEPLPLNSQKRPLVIDDSPAKGMRQNTNTVYFDENDFDSDIDIDLEIEYPTAKDFVTYPKLPSAPLAYPTIPNTLHETIPVDSGYGSRVSPNHEPPPPSSVPIPWSSSPLEHKNTPPEASLIQRYTYGGPKNVGMSRTKPEPAKTKPLPTKRRTLPWLEDDEPNNMPTEDSQASLFRSKVGSRASNGTYNGTHHPGKVESFTPLPKNSIKLEYPWNTTASAIKAQQKQHRQANEKHAKANDITPEGLKKASTKTRSSVSKIFLSEEQQHVLKLATEDGKSVFFTGSAGTGKSVLLREIIAKMRKKYVREPDRVAVTASTGLAACNVGGVTLHSFAGIGLGKEEVPELLKKVRRNQKAFNRWRRTKVLIIDEISMVDGELFDKLEALARQLRKNGRPFGGIQLIITGDFFQLPPVPDRGKIAKFAFDAGTWSTSIDHTIALHHVFRQKDPVFANMLNEMREGRLTSESISSFKTLNRPLSFQDDLQATELFPTRVEVDKANNDRMDNLFGVLQVFTARDGGTAVDKAQRDKLLQNCMAPESIELKKGAQVMLIKNVDESLVNGSLGKVLAFMTEARYAQHTESGEDYYPTQNDVAEDFAGNGRPEKKSRMTIQDHMAASTAPIWPMVQFTLADGTTRQLLCQPELWKVELPNGEVQASRQQIPLILAWALSIHKAQGQTLERVKVDLGKVFEKGQAYVALSRATNMAGLQVLRFDPKKVVAHERVRTFYQNLSRVELQEGNAERAAKKGKKQGGIGISAGEYERNFMEQEQDFDDEEAAMVGYE